MNIETVISLLSLVVTVVVAIWGIYQTQITSKLEAQVHKLSVDLDQRVQRLYRLREIVINIHTCIHALIESLSPEMGTIIGDDRDYSYKRMKNIYDSAMAFSVNQSEFSAMAEIIGDEELRKIAIDYEQLSLKTIAEGKEESAEEMKKLRDKSKRAFKRIYQLIEIATK